MSEIKNIRLNKVEVKLADTDDPIALKVSWDPANYGGSNFKSQKMTIFEDKILIKKTGGTILFLLIFTVLGLLGLLVGSPYFFLKGKIGVGIFMIAWGSIFGGFGILMLRSDKKVTFDKLDGLYFRGKEYDKCNLLDRAQQGHLKDIHAIQLINKRIGGGSMTFTGYELNLVFKDGERTNVMDHGKGEDVEDSAKQLGDFLNVPIWKAQY